MPAPPPDIAYLEELLAKQGELGPRPERVSAAFADERIREKIGRFPDERQQAGLWGIDKALRDADVAPAFRLHLVSAVAQLSRIADDSRAARIGRIQP